MNYLVDFPVVIVTQELSLVGEIDNHRCPRLVSEGGREVPAPIGSYRADVLEISVLGRSAFRSADRILRRVL